MNAISYPPPSITHFNLKPTASRIRVGIEQTGVTPNGNNPSSPTITDTLSLQEQNAQRRHETTQNTIKQVGSVAKEGVKWYLIASIAGLAIFGIVAALMFHSFSKLAGNLSNK